MKSIKLAVFFLISLMAPVLLGGCGQKESQESDHDESPSGASFSAGKGVALTDETRNILGLEIADVVDEKLPRVVRFNVQVFGETHRLTLLSADHVGCDIHGSGYLPTEKALLIKPKEPVKLLTRNNEVIEGFVLAVQNTLALGETEVVVGASNAAGKLSEGEFLAATISLPREEAVTVIPASALLRTAEGTFVYVVNGGAYLRTEVKVGSESAGKIEIIDGLYSGDQVVTKPVETLWIIELRATKGGGHSH